MKPSKMIQTCKDFLAKEGSKFPENGKKLLHNAVEQMEADFEENKGNGFIMMLKLKKVKRIWKDYQGSYLVKLIFFTFSLVYWFLDIKFFFFPFKLFTALKMENNEMQEHMDLLSERFSCGICCNR